MRRAWLAALLLLPAAALAWGSRADSEPLPVPAKADSILILKSQRELILLKDGAPLKTYRVALGRGGLAAKRREGDSLTPEGAYIVDKRNPRSSYHLGLHVSYPSPTDETRARGQGQDPGGDIMIHGIRNGLGWLGRLHRLVDWTAGCIAVTNPEIEEIWRATPDRVPVEIRA